MIIVWCFKGTETDTYQSMSSIFTASAMIVVVVVLFLHSGISVLCSINASWTDCAVLPLILPLIIFFISAAQGPSQTSVISPQLSITSFFHSHNFPASVSQYALQLVQKALIKLNKGIDFISNLYETGVYCLGWRSHGRQMSVQCGTWSKIYKKCWTYLLNKKKYI